MLFQALRDTRHGAAQPPTSRPQTRSSVRLATQANLTWIDAGALTRPNNYFYVVRATAGNRLSPASNRSGKFAFP